MSDSVCHRHPAAWTLVAVWVLSVCPVAFAQTRPAFEKVMRDAQARYQYFYPTSSWPWPACCGQSSGNAPAYPPDGYYGPTVNATCGRDLVQAIADCMEHFVTHFVSPSYAFLEGTNWDPGAHHLALTDMGWDPGPTITITTTNYLTKLAMFDLGVQICKYRDWGAVADVDPDTAYYAIGTNGGHQNCPYTGGYPNCPAALTPAIEKAECAWSANGWSGPVNAGPVSMFESACANETSPGSWTATVTLRSIKGRIISDMQNEPATTVAAIYIKVLPYTNGVSNNPPVQADGNWHRHDTTTGAQFYTGAHMADEMPECTSECALPSCVGDAPREKGWQVSAAIAMLTVHFAPRIDTGHCWGTSQLPPDQTESSGETESDLDDADNNCTKDDLKGGDNGSTPETARPIDIQSGHKTERVTDLAIRLTGPDLSIVRQYVSQPDLYSSGSAYGYVGANWTLSPFQRLTIPSGSGTSVLHIGGSPVRRHRVFRETSSGSGVWRPSGPSHQSIDQTTLNVDNQVRDTWRLKEPGGWERHFIRGGGEHPSYVVAGTEGRILLERDPYGNARIYRYAAFTTTTSGVTARLQSITCTAASGPTESGNPEATIVFYWNTDPGLSDQLRGKLGSILVYRYTPTAVVTDRVEYTYKEGSADHLGTEGDLIQVTTYSRVDRAPAEDPPVEPFRVQVAQYRYWSGSSVSNSDERLAGTGQAHQMRLELMPEQIEFIARETDADSVLDTASDLLSKTDSQSPTGVTGRAVIDYAAKIVSYGASGYGEVSKQYTQTACGCGSGSSQGMREDYVYLTYSTGGMVWSTQITEKKWDASTSAYVTHRIVSYDLRPKGDYNSPYLVTKAIEEPGTNGLQWVWNYEYGTGQNILRKRMPSAIEPTQRYVRATTGNAPTYQADDDHGLVLAWDYNGDGRVTESRVGNGDLSTYSAFTLVEKTTYRSSTRTYLPETIERFRVAGSTSANNVETTTFEYAFYTPVSIYATVDGISYVKNSVEAELESENGPTVSSPLTYDSYELFDVDGNNRWSRGADLALTYREFEPGTGAVSLITRNAPATGLVATDYGLAGSSGWGRSSDGGSFTTTYTHDPQGRLWKSVAPGGISTYTVREMLANSLEDGPPAYAEISLPHQLTSSSYDGPASVTWYNAADKATRRSGFYIGGTTYDPVSPDFDYTLGTEIARAVSTYTYSGLLDSREDWHDVAGDRSYTTSFKYDSLGRLQYQIAANGSITSNAVYDVLGRVLAVEVGTSLSTPDFVRVAEYYFDSGGTTTQTGGDGDLTLIREFTGENGALAASQRDTKRTYDFRHRLRVVERPSAPHEATDHDNLDRVAKRGLFDTAPGLTYTWPTTDSTRGLHAETLYSQRGLVYKQKLAITPADLGGGYLETNVWFEAEGRSIADWRPNAPATKRVYDGLGRAKAVYVSDRGGDAMPGATDNHANASDVYGDIMQEQTELTYNSDASRWGDRLVLSRTLRRRHDLSASLTGDLSNSEYNSIATFVGYFYDGGGRRIRTVNFGTNTSADVFQSGGTVTGWPPTNPPSAPNGLGTALISSVVYNARGLVDTTADPSAHETRYLYDDLSRRYALIENPGTTAPTISWNSTAQRWEVTAGLNDQNPDVNRVTSFVYDAAGNVVKQVAHLPTGTSEKVQITQYTYTTSVGSVGTTTDSLVASKNLLSEVQYPDETTGAPGSGNAYKVKYSYNRLGELRTVVDQNQTQHTYTRDTLGRVLNDTPGFASGTVINQRIKRIGAAYDSHGRLSTVKSYSAIEPSTVVVANAVEFMYRPLWQVERVFQDHDSDISRSGNTPTGNSVVVQYAYTTAAPASGTAGSDYSRIASLTYPDGKVVDYAYGSSGSADDRISRVISQGYNGESLAIAAYSRIGLDLFAAVDLAQADVQLDRTFSQDGKRRLFSYTGQNAGVYPGWDRYGRVAIQAWMDGAVTTSSGSYPNKPPIVDEAYTYDYSSNRLTAYDARPGARLGPRDREYAYDGLARLKEAKRGIHGTTWTAGIGSQDWILDMLGNWTQNRTDLDGNGSYSSSTETETRGHNEANEITQRNVPVSLTLPFTHDDAGNLRTAKFSSTATNQYTHDAWNRLVKHEYTGTGASLEVADFEYNGLHWRTLKKVYLNTSGGEDDDPPTGGTLGAMYYSASWQLLEERIDDDFQSAPGTNRIAQEVWGLRYIDDVVMRRQYDPNTSNPDVRHYHLTDVQFSTVAMIGTGTAPTLYERIRYDAYGKATHRWPGDFNDDGYVKSTDDQGYYSDSNHNGAIGTGTYNVDLDLNRSGTIGGSGDLIRFNQWLGKGPLAEGEISSRSGLASSAPDNVFGFDGYVFSPEVSLYCVRFRWYDAVTGRWLERDPWGLRDGLLLYQYTRGDPIDLVDPMGLASLCPHKALDRLKNIEDAIKKRCPTGATLLGITPATPGAPSASVHLPVGVGFALTAATVTIMDERQLHALTKMLEANQVAAKAAYAAGGRTLGNLAARQMARNSGIAARKLGSAALRGGASLVGGAGVFYDGWEAIHAYEEGDIYTATSSASSAGVGVVLLGATMGGMSTGPLAVVGVLGVGAAASIDYYWESEKSKQYDPERNGDCVRLLQGHQMALLAALKEQSQCRCNNDPPVSYPEDAP